MMHMPRRNVTRFFIPLIDVLILLFCIFLLMEFNSGAEADMQTEKVAEQTETMEDLSGQLNRRIKELQKFEELRPQLVELEKLREEVDRLRNQAQRNMQQQAYVRIIDINPKDGSISFFDDRNPKNSIVQVANIKSAQGLIDRHKAEAGKREMYYYFMYPRQRTIYPLFGQEQEYKVWFKNVANSLVKVTP
ncbi:MAG: hypothetical protein EXS16_08825 [Gemmataceae bacterium]|nr:hypothetical protein [Gemmataceae bacterium]